jgi:acetyl-CoA carboxylase carboxyl transferase subunit beta
MNMPAALHRQLAELISQDADMRMIARTKRFNRVGYGSTSSAGSVE